MSLSLLRSYIKILLESSTPRISDLSKEDLIVVIEDILGREPFASYTEKLAGQSLTVHIKDGEVLGQFKGSEPAPWADLAGVSKEIKSSSIPRIFPNIVFQFEVLKPENRPDYLDYAIGNKTVVVEFTGKLTKEFASKLNSAQSNITFLTKSDIVKKPKRLSIETSAKMQEFLSELNSSDKISKAKKQEIEASVSSAFFEIFGESIFGGPSEGVFVSGTSKSFKIPDKTYADVQRIMAGIYAVFSAKSKISFMSIVERFTKVASGETPETSDKIVVDLKNYLTEASAGFPSGYRTFFSPIEARNLLSIFKDILRGRNTQVRRFLSTIKERVQNKDEWHSTRNNNKR